MDHCNPSVEAVLEGSDRKKLPSRARHRLAGACWGLKRCRLLNTCGGVGRCVYVCLYVCLYVRLWVHVCVLVHHTALR